MSGGPRRAAGEVTGALDGIGGPASGQRGREGQARQDRRPGAGRVHETVLEVLRYDPSTGESIVVSAYGPAAGWYRSLRAEPAVRVRTGRLTYGPVQQRFLQPVEAREIAEEFSRRHPLEARLIPTVLGLIGASGAREAPDGRELLASLPMVALRPGSR